MSNELSLALIFGPDYDQIKNELFGAMPRHWRDNLHKLGLSHGLHDLAQTMILCRYTPPQKRVPQIKFLAAMMGYTEAHVRDMLHSMEAADLIDLIPKGRILLISISKLVKRLRGLWRKREKPAAEKVPPRLPAKNPRGQAQQPAPEPEPAPAPEPIPFPVPDPVPPAAEEEEEENELDAEIAAKLKEQKALQAILNSAPRRSPQYEDARSRWQDISRWLAAHAPLLVAVLGGG